jgi:hypothetical protein
MGKLKEYFFDYLSSEEFDLMTDEEYEQWIKQQQEAMEESYQYCQ